MHKLNRKYLKADSQSGSAPVFANRLAGLLKSPIFFPALIGAITFVTFAHVLKNDFVMWDDDWLIYSNPSLGSLSLKNLRLIFANVTISSSWYTPLTGLRWSITYQFFRLNPFGYHLGNLLFHVADAVLIFFLIRKLLRHGFSKQSEDSTGLWRITVASALATLFWSLHPLRVEPVAWAAAGAYGQALFFLLISLLCYLHANRTGITARGHFGLLSIAVVSYLASLLCQPIGLGFAAVLLVLDVYPLGRLSGGRRLWKSISTRRVLLEKLPFITVAMAVAILTVFLHASQSKGGHFLPSFAEFGMFNRVMQATYIWAYYVWRPFYPINLAPIYTDLMAFNPFSLQFIASGLAVISTIILLVIKRHRWPLGLAIAIFHLVMLVPNLGLLEHPHVHADRYSTIVSIGLSVLLSALLANPKIRKFSHSILLVLTLVVITTLGRLSLQQTDVWNNNVTFFSHILKTLGDHPHRQDIHWRLGTALARRGYGSKAIEQFKKTLEIRPDRYTVRYSLALTLAKEGEISEAISHYHQVIRDAPDFVEAYADLGVAYAKLGEHGRAVSFWTKAVRLKPDFIGMLNNLAWILATTTDDKVRNAPVALEYARKACELTGYEDYISLDVLAVTYAAAGRWKKAFETAEKAMFLAESAADKNHIRRIQKRIKMYRTGQVPSSY